ACRAVSSAVAPGTLSAQTRQFCGELLLGPGTAIVREGAELIQPLHNIGKTLRALVQHALEPVGQRVPVGDLHRIGVVLVRIEAERSVVDGCHRINRLCDHWLQRTDGTRAAITLRCIPERCKKNTGTDIFVNAEATLLACSLACTGAPSKSNDGCA